VVRVGLVGCGGAARRGHCPALLERGICPTAVCDPRLAGDDGWPFLTAPRYESATQMVRSEPLDLLVVASPPEHHEQAIVAGLSAGLDVVCEKPLVTSERALDAVRRAVRSQPNRLLATVNQYRFARGWSILADAIRSARGWRQLDVTVARPGIDPFAREGWRADPRHGGLLGDHGIHYIGLGLEAFGPLQVTDVARTTSAGMDHVRMSLAAQRAVMTVKVTMEPGRPRRNTMLLRADGICVACWDGGLLVQGGCRVRLASLADRAAVDRLYGPFYDNLLGRLSDVAWRRATTAFSIDGARLLADCFARLEGEPAGWRVERP
jgi:hypothetical protein